MASAATTMLLAAMFALTLISSHASSAKTVSDFIKLYAKNIYDFEVAAFAGVIPDIRIVYQDDDYNLQDISFDFFVSEHHKRNATYFNVLLNKFRFFGWATITNPPYFEADATIEVDATVNVTIRYKFDAATGKIKLAELANADYIKPKVSLSQYGDIPKSYIDWAEGYFFKGFNKYVISPLLSQTVEQFNKPPGRAAITGKPATKIL